MLVYNEYLKELGVKEDDFPFKAPHETELDKKSGVIPCQTWNLNTTIAMELYTYLRAFKDIKPGYPACISAEEWDAILDEMIEGFAEVITKRDDVSFLTSSDNTKLNRSFNLMKQWWEALWW